jgi:hypothetical protein
MEFMDVEAKPENLGWAMLVEHVETSDEYKRFNRVGLIVDSDLDSLKGYNAGEAIYGSLFLPPRIKLIYASCDSGGEFFATQMLRFADSVASRCLDELEAGRVALNTKTIEGAPYKSYRHLVSAYHW